jgi:hypothetical protein
VRRGEENSKNGCWLEGELEFKKPRTRASPSCAAHDGHARVPLGIPTALSPMSREFEPVRSLPEVRFALYKGHFARKSPRGKSSGGPVIEDFESTDRNRPETLEPVRRSKVGPKLGLKRKHLTRCNSGSTTRQQDGPRTENWARQSGTGPETLAQLRNREVQR